MQKKSSLRISKSHKLIWRSRFKLLLGHATVLHAWVSVWTSGHAAPPALGWFFFHALLRPGSQIKYLKKLIIYNSFSIIHNLKCTLSFGYFWKSNTGRNLSDKTEVLSTDKLVRSFSQGMKQFFLITFTTNAKQSFAKHVQIHYSPPSLSFFKATKK